MLTMLLITTDLQAYYALIVRGRLRPGESILIHSGSGGVGQAAIAIALSMNCTVYTTVGSEGKKAFLMKQFPQVRLGCASQLSKGHFIMFIYRFF